MNRRLIRSDRINQLEQYIMERGTANLEELTAKFDISMNTLRRDLEELSIRGNIKKVYGGASSKTHPMLTTLHERQSRNFDAKMRIGKIASNFMDNNQLVFIDSGSTCACVISYLQDKENVTIVTHSLTAMEEVSKYSNLNLIGIGGSYYKVPRSFIGMDALSTLKTIAFDIVFVGTTSILPEGLATNIFVEAEVKRTLTEQGNRIILLADESKYNHPATYRFCTFNQIDVFITDKKPSGEINDNIKASNIQMVIT